MVAASGTGCQQLLALLDHAGVGVSSALGVGGRDLSAEVGGLATREALRRLDEDPAVELIVLVSKPPAPEVATEITAYADALATPVELALLGPGQPDLTAAAERVLTRLGREVPEWPVVSRLGAGAPSATSEPPDRWAVRRRDALQGGVAHRGPGRGDVRRLRRRRVHPGPGAPDDRPDAAARGARPGCRRPRGRRAAARRGARPRRRGRPGGAARPGARGRRRSRW